MKLRHTIGSLAVLPLVCVVLIIVWVCFKVLEAAGAVFGVIRTMYRKLRV